METRQGREAEGRPKACKSRRQSFRGFSGYERLKIVMGDKFVVVHLDRILEQPFQSRFWGINSRVFSVSSFCLFFYPHFSVLQNAIHKKTRVFLISGFFVGNFKNREKCGFLYNTPVEGTVNSMEQKS